MQFITTEGIVFHCKWSAPDMAEFCELLPIAGVDTDDTVQQSIKEVKAKYNPRQFKVTWIQPPANILVRVYLEANKDLIIEGSQANYGNIYAATFPVGQGAYVANTSKYLGITAEALPVFRQIWENAEDAGIFLAQLNWFHCDDGTALFCWKGPVKMRIKPNEKLTRRGSVALDEKLFRIIE